MRHLIPSMLLILSALALASPQLRDIQPGDTKPILAPSIELGLMVECGDPSPRGRQRNYLGHGLHEITWDQFIAEKIAPYDVPHILVWTAHPNPPGRIRTDIYTAMPEHLQDSLKAWQPYSPKLWWYSGTPVTPPTMADLERELTPIIAATGCRRFVLDAMPLDDAWWDVYQAFGRRYDVEFWVEPVPLHPARPDERLEWSAKGVRWLSLDQRDHCSRRRIREGELPAYAPWESIAVANVKGGEFSATPLYKWPEGAQVMYQRATLRAQAAAGVDVVFLKARHIVPQITEVAR
jgi:hypothetical protein